MIVIPYINLETKSGRYTAVLPEIITEQPDTEFGYYVSDGIGRFNLSENGSIGFADVFTKIHLRFQDLTDQDLYNNISGIKTVSQLERVFESGVGFDERMIVTLIEFEYTPFE